VTPHSRALVRVLILLGVFATLLWLFPRALAWVELAARELRYFWWIVLLCLLAIWLIWGIGRKPKA
jgi:hypothetical protein